MESKADEKRAYFREQSLNELMYTEKQYVEDLEFIISHFLEPLRDQKILNKLELKAIFSTVEVIIKINKILYEQLSERLNKDTNIEEILLGDIFLKLADFLKVYTTYIGDQEGCISTFQNCKSTNKLFAAFLKDCGRNPEYRGLDLVSYLIKPVQRICKYPLLLRQIVAYTPETAADYEVMKQVLNKFEEVTVYANEHKRRMEKQQAMVQTSKLIVSGGFNKFPQLITPSRYFVRSWEWVRISQSGRIKEVQVFLFNDLLVETSRKKKNGEYVQRAQIGISGLSVKDHPDTSKFKNLLELRRKDGKTFVYSSVSRTELEQWREAIQGQINEITNIEKDLTRHCSKSEISRRNPLSLSISAIQGTSSSPSSPARDKLIKGSDLGQSFSLPTKDFLGAMEECYSEEDVEDDSYDETDDETIDQDII